AASINIEGNVRSTGSTNWRKGYDEQVNFRRSQIDRMSQFAESPQCRMSALIQHFGDTSDGLRPCGHCDFCAPEQATAQTFRAPTQQEDRQLRAILRSLDGGAAKATGKLHTDLALGIDRKQFDAYLDALTRAGLITLNLDNFTNAEGTNITFKRASLTHEGRTRDEGDDLAIHLRDVGEAPTKSRKSATGSRSGSGRPSTTSRKVQQLESTATYTPEQKDLEARIREWRKAEAAKTGKPPFIVFSDGVLHSIVQARPRTIPNLLNVSGIGPEKADRYGAAICALCDSRPTPGEYGEISTASVRPTPMKPKSSTKPSSVPMQTKDSAAEGTETFHRQRAASSDPAEALTPDQQKLDQRLRDWRKAESERLGLPQFFVLASSTLRSIVLTRPQTLTQLKAIQGIAIEKVEKFGPAILEVCAS
ncbi:MAG: ATP-dependent helicase, RecQ family, partial [Edaphobacter sp.]|nr:ATP-dependent helicase, RecQ family [Edaphobacter sp.]